MRVGPEHSRPGSQLAAWPFAEPYAVTVTAVADAFVLVDGREGR